MRKKNKKQYELHNFADPSTFEYGQCFYLRVKDEEENANVSQVMESPPSLRSRLLLCQDWSSPQRQLQRLGLLKKILNTVLNDFQEKTRYLFTSHLFI